jgi:hypothetical protein
MQPHTAAAYGRFQGSLTDKARFAQLLLSETGYDTHSAALYPVGSPRMPVLPGL